MKRNLLAIALVVSIASSAGAVEWSRFIGRMATYTPDANVPSPTLYVGHCQYGASIELFDTALTFTGRLQTCSEQVLYGVASTTGNCQPYHTTVLDSAGTHGETEVFAAYIRLDPIAGFGTGYAVVTCKNPR